MKITMSTTRKTYKRSTEIAENVINDDEKTTNDEGDVT